MNFTATSKINPHNFIVVYKCTDSVVDTQNLFTKYNIKRKPQKFIAFKISCYTVYAASATSN